MIRPGKMLVLLTALTALGVGVSSHAETAQQGRMKTCNAEAKTKALSGEERRDFMKSCLSTHAPAGKALNSQQQKMKSCSAEAKSKSLKGSARKEFMSGCLKGH